MFETAFDFVYTNLTYFSIAAVILQFVHLWFYSEGKLKFAYPLAFVVYSTYLVVETTLGFASPEQVGILIFNIVNIWGMIMAVRGWRKLRAGVGRRTFIIDEMDVLKLSLLAKKHNVNIIDIL